MLRFPRSLMVAIGFSAMMAAGSAAFADQPSYYQPPHFKVQVKPNYPASARARHETGTVLVKVLVMPDGTPKSFTIVRSSGHKDLDDEVLRVAKLSTYAPATRDGKPVVAFYDFSYNFTLSGLASPAVAGDLEKRLAANPTNVPLRTSVIEAAINQNNYAQAEKVADEGVSRVPGDARLWAARGEAYYADGVANHDDAKLKIAAESYDRALQINPAQVQKSSAAASFAQYAFGLMADQQYQACLPYASKAVTLVPNAFEYHFLKGDCEAGLDPQSSDALADYQAALKLDDKKRPDLTSRLYASLGNIELNQGNLAAGLQSLAEAQRIDPKAPYAYQIEAVYYINHGNLNAALNPLMQLAQLAPNDPQPQINMGGIYLRQKNFAAAQEAFSKALAIAPNNPDAQFGLAELPAAKGDVKNIDAPLQKAIALAPANAAAYNATIAQMLLSATTDKQDYSADAQRYAQAATQADPNYAMGWYSLGIAYADQRKTDQANSALRKAFDLFKAKNDMANMQLVDKAWVQLNGKDKSLLNGSGVNERTNQPGQGAPAGR